MFVERSVTVTVTGNDECL